MWFVARWTRTMRSSRRRKRTSGLSWYRVVIFRSLAPFLNSEFRISNFGFFIARVAPSQAVFRSICDGRREFSASRAFRLCVLVLRLGARARASSPHGCPFDSEVQAGSLHHNRGTCQRATITAVTSNPPKLKTQNQELKTFACAQASSAEEKKKLTSMAAFSGESEPWMAFRSMDSP